MIKRQIEIYNDGYILCKSSFYSVDDVLEQHQKFCFTPGVNKLIGDIDSGIFAISYLMSMYKTLNKELLFLPHELYADGKVMSLGNFQEMSCYMDCIFPLFSSNKTVRCLVSKGLEKSKLPFSSDEICELFHMEKFRFDRSIKASGHECYRAMAAVGFSYGKSVFCFPWMSKRRFEAFHGHLTDTLDILANMKKFVILPTGI